jgi:diaminohydroxyphosphoribosylaminopyrimidine deaminase/5-amino-6-(5-phosphoribosylamino)uracil reductase
MARAIELSARGLGQTFPNPVVGAVLISSSGEIIGEGFHAGGDHAEVVALEDCRSRGNSTLGSTMIASLEPCNHTGKRPPCTRAILDAGVAKVVYAVKDPNPIAMGGGEYLRSQGVDVIPHVLETEAAFVNRAWLHKMKNKRPHITWKIASTFDGYIAALDGSSKWITSPESRTAVQKLRAESDAILIGTGTALSDNPSLVPHDDPRRPLRIVMGERAVPQDAQLQDSRARTLFLSYRQIDRFLDAVRDLGINSILVEAGPTLGTALLEEGVIDEIHWFQAPTILGAGKKAISDLGIETLSKRRDYVIIKNQLVGPDLLTVLLLKSEVHI